MPRRRLDPHAVRVARDLISRGEHSLTDIGKRTGITASTLSRWAKAMGVPVKPRTDTELHDRVKRMLTRHPGLHDAEVARQCACAHRTVALVRLELRAERAEAELRRLRRRLV